MKIRHLSRFGLFVLLVGAVPRAHAQWAVIDVQAVVQLMQQVQTLNQALSTARGQLAQAQREFQSMSGTRGMQNLLSGTIRNYLPATLTDLSAALDGVSVGYSGLSGAIQAAVRANAVLSPQQLAALSGEQQARVAAWRSTVALLQAVTGSAVANTSSRFAAIQQLISAIGAAPDQKSVLDLQARIGAEAGMLQNEQSKLQALYQAVQARQWADAQQDRESVLADHGLFSQRFAPAP